MKNYEKNEGLLSISELARYARISRTALIHYDHLGLISPVERGENNYRLYSHRQITTLNLISTLQDLKLPLREINEIINMRTPERIIDLFAKQGANLDKFIEELISARELMSILSNIISGALTADENAISVEEQPEQRIFLGRQIDYSAGKSIEDATLDFYKYAKRSNEDMNLNYPVWGLYSGERIKTGDWIGPDKFYLYNPHGPDIKPCAKCVVGYSRGYYGETDELYRRLLAYIKINKLKITGPAYEEYPLNEICIIEPTDYLVRISITIE